MIRIRPYVDLAFYLYVVCLPLLTPSVSAPGLEWKHLVLADFAFALLMPIALISLWERLFVDRGLYLYSGLVFLAISLSLLASRAISTGFPDLLRLAYSLVVFLVVSHLPINRNRLVWTARVWAATAGAISLLSVGGWVWALTHGSQSFLAYGVPAFPVLRVGGTLGINAFILYLQSAVFFVLVLLLDRNTSIVERRVLAGALALLFLASALTVSRGIIGLLVFLFFAACFYKGAQAKMLKLTLGGMLTLGVIGGIVTTTWAIFPMRVELNHADRVLHIEMNARPSFYHIVHMAALRMFLSSPVIGVGLGRFGTMLPAVTTEVERNTAWPKVPVVAYLDPHSTWFGWLAETGLLGIAGFATFFLYLLARLLGAKQEGHPDWSARLAGFCLIGFIVNGLHVEIIHLKFFWTLLGIAIAHQVSTHRQMVTERS